MKNFDSFEIDVRPSSRRSNGGNRFRLTCGIFGLGNSQSSTSVSQPTATSGGASSPTLAGDGALATGGVAIGKKGKQDNSVSTKVGNTTTTYTVAKGGTLNLGTTTTPAPVGNATAPAVIVPASSDNSSLLAGIANLVSTARSSVTGTASPISVTTVGKYLFIAAFPVAAFVIWFLFFRNKKSA